MHILKHTVLVALVALLSVSLAGAQDWRGMGRAAGKVTDEQGKPLADVIVKLNLPGSGGIQVKTNKKGEWAVGGIARGDWQVDFELKGYEPRHITVSINELTRLPPVETTLKEAPPDPNEVIKADLTRASELLQQQKFAEARAVYEGILAKYPQAYQVEPLIARTYYGEKNYDQAIEHLRIAVQKMPDNVETKILLGNILVEQGRADEGRQVLASVDDNAVKDPFIFLNVGISLYNQGKFDDALVYFNKAIARFPERGESYWYRALVELGKDNTAAAKTDCQKVLELAPDTPEAALAKKALEQLK